MSELTRLPSFEQPIAAAIMEACKIDYQQVQPVILHLRVTLTASTTEDRDPYRMPPDFGFLGWEMRAHLRFNDVDGESTSGVSNSTSVLEYGGMQQRALLKAMNCQYQIANLDETPGGLNFVADDGRNSGGRVSLPTRLSTLMPPAGKPILWCKGRDIFPLIVRPKQRLQGTFTLITTNDARLTRTTEYGVAIWGAFVHKSAGVFQGG